MKTNNSNKDWLRTTFTFVSMKRKLNRKTSFLAFWNNFRSAETLLCDACHLHSRRISLFSDFIRLAHQYTKGWHRTQPNSRDFLDSIQSNTRDVFFLDLVFKCRATTKQPIKYLSILANLRPFVYYLNGPNYLTSNSKHTHTNCMAWAWPNVKVNAPTFILLLLSLSEHRNLVAIVHIHLFQWRH